MGVRGGTGLLSCPTDVSPRESILPPSRITGSPPRARIFASRNPIPRSLARARDTHNFAIMIPETGGLSRAVIDPSRGDFVGAARPLIFFTRGNEIFQMLSRSVHRSLLCNAPRMRESSAASHESVTRNRELIGSVGRSVDRGDLSVT